MRKLGDCALLRARSSCPDSLFSRDPRLLTYLGRSARARIAQDVTRASRPGTYPVFANHTNLPPDAFFSSFDEARRPSSPGPEPFTARASSGFSMRTRPSMSFRRSHWPPLRWQEEHWVLTIVCLSLQGLSGLERRRERVGVEAPTSFFLVSSWGDACAP